MASDSPPAPTPRCIETPPGERQLAGQEAGVELRPGVVVLLVGLGFGRRPQEIDDLAAGEIPAEVSGQLVDEVVGVPERPFRIGAIGRQVCLVMGLARLLEEFDKFLHGLELTEPAWHDEAMDEPYYRPDLSLVHHRGFGFHADRCAPGILSLLEPVRRGQGTVLELGCGSGLLTRHLVAAGHRVIATDASLGMLELAAGCAPEAEIRQIVLPDDPLPEADAVVSVGHVLSYLDSEEQIEKALAAVASALLPGGVLALDICDLEWGRHRQGAPADGRVGDDWALITEYATPAPNRFDRTMTAFVRTDDGTWQRDDEVHRNILIDTSIVPDLLAANGVVAEVGVSFGSETQPVGLMTVMGHRP